MKTSFIQVDNEMVLFMVVEELGSITDITIVCLILSGRPNFKEPTETGTEYSSTDDDCLRALLHTHWPLFVQYNN